MILKTFTILTKRFILDALLSAERASADRYRTDMKRWMATI